MMSVARSGVFGEFQVFPPSIVRRSRAPTPRASTAALLDAGASCAELTSGGVRKRAKLIPPFVEREAPPDIPVGQTAQTTRVDVGASSPPRPGTHGPAPVTNVRPASLERASSSFGNETLPGRVPSNQRFAPCAARSRAEPSEVNGNDRVCHTLAETREYSSRREVTT